MSEFKPITTQEELDLVISDRLKRERETSARKYEGWKSPDDIQKLIDEHAKELKKLQDAAAETEKVLKEKDDQIAESARYRTDLEKTRIALAAGLKIDYADRLRGENVDEWKADAEILARDFAASHTAAPVGNPDPSSGNQSTRDQFASWLNSGI